ncbi:MAG: AbrB/MazE/SpoVT family DNA-binding domain-containing protein [Oscillatoria sp. SIO1A7]|nr:AbrB/MazE/SpoVT family DNA-binding domain-containing protein [Oscillatoria sp. SIO1A7]
MPTATLAGNGEIIVPQEIREFLKLKPGDNVDFIVEEDGRVAIRPSAIAVRELKGILHRQGMKPVSIEEMNAAAIRGWSGQICED